MGIFKGRSPLNRRRHVPLVLLCKAHSKANLPAGKEPKFFCVRQICRQAKSQRMLLFAANLPAGKEPTDAFVCGEFARRQRANGCFCVWRICPRQRANGCFLLAANLPAGKEPTDAFCLRRFCLQAKSGMCRLSAQTFLPRLRAAARTGFLFPPDRRGTFVLSSFGRNKLFFPA